MPRLLCISLSPRTAASSSFWYPTFSACSCEYPKAAASWTRLRTPQVRHVVRGFSASKGQLTSRNQPIDSRDYHVFRLVRLQHIHSLVIDIRSMVYHVHAVLYTHLDGIPSSCMGTESLSVGVSFLNAGCSFFVRVVAVLGCADLGDLKP